MVREIKSTQSWYDPGIVDLLTRAGLAHHIQVFLDERIDLGVAAKLTDENLKELNLPIGDRHRLSEALANLSQTETVPEGRISIDAQRRQLTALFSDMVGSTELLRSLDPEDYRELLSKYRSLLNRELKQHGGKIIHFAGDGVVAVFGYPRSHDDDAQRAVRAALNIVARVSDITLPGTNETLGLRIGIASGTCVVGDIVSEGTAEEDGIVGEAINLASRIQSHARVNGVIICPVTKSIAAPEFDLEPAEAIEARGFADAVQAWHVKSVFQGKSLHALTGMSLVGSTDLLDRLKAEWQATKRGRQSAFVLCGQAGAGKTRLLNAFRNAIDVEPEQTIVWSGNEIFANTALYSVANWVREELGLHHGTLAAPEKLSQFRTGDAFQPHIKRNVLGHLIGDAEYLSETEIDGLDRRKTLLSMCVSHIRIRSQRSPVLIVVEDLHWIDSTTQELISRLNTDLENCPVMIVSASRGNADQIRETIGTPLPLDRLNDTAAATLVRETAGDVPLEDAAVAAIVRRSEGVPLYIVEITRLVVSEQQRGGHGTAAIPATIRGALTARFDPLKEHRELALVLSVLGREFEFDLLPELTGLSKDNLDAALDYLVSEKILEPIVHPSGPAWRFTHALVHEAAYECVLKRQRIDLHKNVIALYAKAQPDLIQREPERLAYHHSNALEYAKAAEAWYNAGQNALRNSAHSEALVHIGKGISEIGKCDKDQTRKALELKLYSTKGRTLISVEGHGSAGVLEALNKAAKLTEEVKSSTDLFPVVWGLNAYHMIRGNVDANVRASKRLVDFAAEDGNHEHIVVAHTSRCLALYYAGRFEEALAHLRTMEKRYDNEQDPELAHKYAVDRLVVGYQHGSWLLWLLGQADAAARMERKLHAHIAAHPHPYSYAQALTSGASVYVLRREPDIMLERARAGIEFARSKGKEVWVDHGNFWIGWALSEKGDLVEGGKLLESALERYVASGTGSSLPKFYALVAENHVRAGKIDEADLMVRKALERIDSFGEQCYLPECRRIEAAVRVKQGTPFSETRAILDSALSVAQAQKAQGWQLRLKRDLAQLLLEAGHRQEAVDILLPMLESMSEGQDTADYREAKALLSEA